MKILSSLVLVYALVVVAAAPARAQECRGSVTSDEAQAAETARYTAQMSGDFTALQKLIGDDLVYTHSSAAVDTKGTYIESMQTGVVKYRSMKRSDVRVRIYGCVAILTGRGDFEVSNKGQDSKVALRFHSIWVKREGSLQFVSWQATRLTPPPATK